MNRYTHLDIETGDPDDLWTLALMSTHPRVNLKSVSVYPGGRDQISLVRKVLALCGRSDVIIAANVKQDNKSRVSPYYTSWVGEVNPEDPDDTILNIFPKIKGSNLLTGGPLTNIHNMMLSNPDDIIFDHWTCQGGFVGANIVTPNYELDKFKGKVTVPTFNFNGNPNAAMDLLVNKQPFNSIRTVGKNVCHGFFITKEQVDNLITSIENPHVGLAVMLSAIQHYYKTHNTLKAMHDILAALLHIDSSCGIWVSGVPYRERGGWGFSDKPESKVSALVGITDYDSVINLLNH